MKRFVRPAFLMLLLGGLILKASAQRGPGGAPPPPPGGGRGPGGIGSPGGPPPAAANNAPNTTSSSPNTPRSTLQIGPVGRWWDDRSISKTVGVRPDQRQKMDTIFDTNKSTIVENYRTLLAEQAKLQTLSKNSQADKAQLFAQIDAVNQARTSLQKVTTQMLLQIREQLDADQITRLQKIQ